MGKGNDILRFIINNGMVNISDIQNSMEAMKREEVLKKKAASCSRCCRSCANIYKRKELSP